MLDMGKTARRLPGGRPTPRIKIRGAGLTTST
ncbi:hypothetical protein Ae168Ps1_6158c [Pseudonocardia sp. Ae168_Ps1]|nr:hypothetical protein Ae150APs1_6091c [Pseudonocardia sp. Ae150A_Ps1]OLL70559.1 hypothetical protein Ae263Ps1_6309c [Pseudonocardia sp. Ae263_Ps1]OLL70693.1 hypothetical protein Ae168Ps1_6158c [Pseudonocardia sp. Ae168_Ps1]OLL89212.1 hypothetical protein Ae356Ps1_6131 [Pseudonocardia sp. Ae356_Ps1]